MAPCESYSFLSSAEHMALGAACPIGPQVPGEERSAGASSGVLYGQLMTSMWHNKHGPTPW